MLGLGNFDKVNRRKVKTRLDQVMYMGHKYRQDKKTGYYICTTGSRKRLHVAIWEHEWGVDVPPGCVIHHLDWNKTNNSVDNLILVTHWEHNRIHNISEQDKVAGISGGKEWGYELMKERGGCGLPGLCYGDSESDEE